MTADDGIDFNWGQKTGLPPITIDAGVWRNIQTLFRAASGHQAVYTFSRLPPEKRSAALSSC